MKYLRYSILSENPIEIICKMKLIKNPNIGIKLLLTNVKIIIDIPI
jgi:hypothetical protein